MTYLIQQSSSVFDESFLFRALLSRETLQQDLKEWDQRLMAIWANQPADLFDLAMADTVRQYPSMPLEPYQDMLKGMLMDVPGRVLMDFELIQGYYFE